MANLETKKTFALFSTPLNKKLIFELRHGQENVLLFPPAATERVVLDETAITHLENLCRFDWLIFPDVFTVEYFIEILRERQTDLFELDAVRVLALGEAVADRLRFEQIHADIIPAKTENEAVFKALAEYSDNNFAGLRFLVPKELSVRFPLAENLTQAGGWVTQLPIYQAKFASRAANVKLKALLKGGAVDEFIFSSPVDLISLKFLFDNEELSDLLRGLTISALDETTFQALLEKGLRPRFLKVGDKKDE
jgi:uroporphyrinogen-III synthase